MTEITPAMMAAGVAAFNEYRSAPLGIGPSDVAASIFNAMDAVAPGPVAAIVEEAEALIVGSAHAVEVGAEAVLDKIEDALGFTQDPPAEDPPAAQPPEAEVLILQVLTTEAPTTEAPADIA